MARQSKSQSQSKSRPSYLKEPRQVADYRTAHAIATDAANHQAKSNRRAEWSMEDYNLACRTLARLFPQCGANPRAGLVEI